MQLLLHASLSLFIFNFFMFLIKWGIFVEFVGRMKSWMTFKLWQLLFYQKWFLQNNLDWWKSRYFTTWLVKIWKKKDFLVHYTELLFSLFIFLFTYNNYISLYKFCDPILSKSYVVSFRIPHWAFSNFLSRAIQLMAMK